MYFRFRNQNASIMSSAGVSGAVSTDSEPVRHGAGTNASAAFQTFPATPLSADPLRRLKGTSDSSTTQVAVLCSGGDTQGTEIQEEVQPE